MSSSTTPHGYPPSISIVLEWENMVRAQHHLADAMLRSVSCQAAAALRDHLVDAIELIAVIDKTQVDVGWATRTIASGIPSQTGITTRIEIVRDLDYYDQKNHGAAVAFHEWIVFIDCDIVPEDKWLEALLAGARASDGDTLIGGNTYIDPKTLLGRAFGAFWGFPRRGEGNAIVPSPGFLANNLIVRRKLFLRYGFQPTIATRSKCALMAARMHADGRSIVRACGARAAHQPPDGLSNFVRRALNEGHDAYVLSPHRTGDRIGRWLRWLPRLARNLARVVRDVVRHRQAVGLRYVDVPAALLVGASYYTLAGAGEIISSIDARLIPERLAM